MQIRDKRLAVIAAAGFGLWIGLSAASAEPKAAKNSDAPIVLSKFNKQKTQASAKTKSHTVDARHGAKIADAANRGKANPSGDALKNLAASPSIANAHAELTAGNPLSPADDEARNLAAIDDNEIVTMNGVQIASADQLNDMDRAVAEEKTEVKSDDVTSAGPAAATGHIIKAVPSGERPIAKSGDSNPWNNTSLIGKIFVAFGSLLTLASAARLMIA